MTWPDIAVKTGEPKNSIEFTRQRIFFVHNGLLIWFKGKMERALFNPAM